MYSKKPKQFPLIRQSYLGVILVIGLSSYDPSTRCCSRSHFPISEKTIQVSGSYGTPDGTNFRTGELKGSVIANGGAKDLPWYARSGTPQSRSVVGTIRREGRTRTYGLLVPNQAIYQLIYFPFHCTPEWIRTTNTRIWNPMLYQLELQTHLFVFPNCQLTF